MRKKFITPKVEIKKGRIESTILSTSSTNTNDYGLKANGTGSGYGQKVNF